MLTSVPRLRPNPDAQKFLKKADQGILSPNSSRNFFSLVREALPPIDPRITREEARTYLQSGLFTDREIGGNIPLKFRLAIPVPLPSGTRLSFKTLNLGQVLLEANEGRQSWGHAANHIKAVALGEQRLIPILKPIPPGWRPDSISVFSNANIRDLTKNIDKMRKSKMKNVSHFMSESSVPFSSPFYKFSIERADQIGARAVQISGIVKGQQAPFILDYIRFNGEEAIERKHTFELLLYKDPLANHSTGIVESRTPEIYHVNPAALDGPDNVENRRLFANMFQDEIAPEIENKAKTAGFFIQRTNSKDVPNLKEVRAGIRKPWIVLHSLFRTPFPQLSASIKMTRALELSAIFAGEDFDTHLTHFTPTAPSTQGLTGAGGSASDINPRSPRALQAVNEIDGLPNGLRHGSRPLGRTLKLSRSLRVLGPLAITYSLYSMWRNSQYAHRLDGHRFGDRTKKAIVDGAADLASNIAPDPVRGYFIYKGLKSFGDKTLDKMKHQPSQI